jgi:hypothetical protein
MAEILNKFGEQIKKFAYFLVLYFAETVQRLIKAGKGIHPKERVKDALAVLSSTSMLLFLNLLALVIFIFLPQGKDVIYIVSEDVGVAHKVSSLLWLLFGLICWSYVSEFASRYALYVTDNSGIGLSDERVRWRKECQRILSSIFLILPYIIVLISILVNCIQDNTLEPFEAKIGFGIPAVLIYLLLNISAKVYFSKPDSPNGAVIKFLMNAKRLPESEKKWAERLYGMYNDFVFTIRKPDNFINEPHDLLEGYIDRITNDQTKTGFPQNLLLMEPNSAVPPAFRLKTFTTEPGKPNGRYRWTYFIPNAFYKCLHRQLIAIVTLCLLVFLIITFLPVNAYQNVGTPALLILSFSCWIGIYLGILFIDYAIFRPRYLFLKEPETIFAEPLDSANSVSKTNVITNDEWVIHSRSSFIVSRISIRFILFFLFIFCSFVNDDHPLHYNTNGRGSSDDRPPLQKHFTDWFKNYASDSTTQYLLKDSSVIMGTDSFHLFKDSSFTYYNNFVSLKAGDTILVHKQNLKFYPVVFICAEGGALRTGAFTAMLLSYLQDTLLISDCPVNFQKTIYAFSAVSGGSLGVSFFNAEAYLNNRDELLVKDALINRTKYFFSRDFLAPVIGKMFYGDVLNLFLPSRLEGFDRAIAIEKSWENAYQEVVNSSGRNYFSSDYMQVFAHKHAYPALFINTTEVESGLQCWLTNVKPDPSMYESEARDLLNYKLHGGINYSTMINFSSRFPLLSPAAAVFQNDNQKFHYVDGGYVENTGSATMVEILQALTPLLKDAGNKLVKKGYAIRPYVIQIRFSDSMDVFKNINFGSELTEVLNGIYNTRAGRVSTATNDLKKVVSSLGGKFITLPLTVTNSSVPMNWVLSDKCVENVKKSIKEQYGTKRMRDLFPFDSTCCKVYR